jgi:hypothetical protein
VGGEGEGLSEGYFAFMWWFGEWVGIGCGWVGCVVCQQLPNRFRPRCGTLCVRRFMGRSALSKLEGKEARKCVFGVSLGDE